MPHRNRVIVVDDKVGDGEVITRRLWKSQVPCFFLHYSDDVLFDLDSEKKFEGIRIVFQDIALVSTGIPDNRDYAAAAAGLDLLLSDENGPWLLVAWSTWGNEPDKGDQYAKDLFSYLKQHLAEGKRPFHYIVLDKQPYLENGEDGMHGAVKPESAISEEEKEHLVGEVRRITNQAISLNVLNQWESDVKHSASRLVNDLWMMVNTDSLDAASSSLSNVLYELAFAAEGKRLKDVDNIAEPLYRILSELLYDKVFHMTPSAIEIEGKRSSKVDKTAINTMLHWESYKEGGGRSPGAIYFWPENKEVNLGGVGVSPENFKTFMVDAFIAGSPAQKAAIVRDDKVLGEAKLVLIDVTAACDYSNKKNFWRRFMVGLMVPGSDKELFYKEDERFKRPILEGQFLKGTPDFICDGKEFSFLFNSRLVLSLNDEKDYLSDNRCGNDESVYLPDIDKLAPVGRLREQLFQELLTWFSGMITRPGVVTLR